MSLFKRKKKQCMKWKHTDYPETKKFRLQWLVKRVTLTDIQVMKEDINNDFLEKGVTINSAACYHLFWQNDSYLFKDAHKFCHQHISQTNKKINCRLSVEHTHISFLIDSLI